MQHSVYRKCFWYTSNLNNSMENLQERNPGRLCFLELAAIRKLWPEFDSEEERLLLRPLPVTFNRCCQQHPLYSTTKVEMRKKLPVTKPNVDCCALLFLTLQLDSNPQITLIGGHGSGWQHIKWLRLMEIPHVQKHISREQPVFFVVVVFFPFWMDYLLKWSAGTEGFISSCVKV